MSVAGFKYYTSSVSRLSEGNAFLHKGRSYVAKTVKRDGGDVFISAEEFDRDNGDDLGLVMLRLSPSARIRVMGMSLGF